ncbi:MAG: hypothetical protein R3D02_14610 [Hyphomicrobiales bacterium]
MDKSKGILAGAAIAAAAIFVAGNLAWSGEPETAGMGGMAGMSGMSGMAGMNGMAGMGGNMPNMMMLAPEYRERISKISKETLKEVQHLTTQHTRYSDDLTLRQVMQEILLDLQGAAAGIATHNGRMAAERARSIANHYIPRGGIIPYLRLDDITDEKLEVLSSMNAAVEGGARALADAAEAGDLAGAATHLSEVMTGCVQCHDIFRGVPGVSPALPPKK